MNVKRVQHSYDPEFDGLYVDPEDLVGREFDYYGAHSGCFKLGDVTLEAVTDPDDGYRSYLRGLRLVDEQPGLRTKLDRVRFEEYNVEATGYADGDESGHQLVSVVDGHVWLRVGTNHADDYYPYVVFRVTPRGTEGA